MIYIQKNRRISNANLRRGTFSQIEDNFYNQALGLIDGGADVLTTYENLKALDADGIKFIT